MIFDMNATKEIFARYQVARDAEDAARKALLSAVEGGLKDMAILDELTTRMTETHNAAMDIWDELQPYRVDV